MFSLPPEVLAELIIRDLKDKVTEGRDQISEEIVTALTTLIENPWTRQVLGSPSTLDENDPGWVRKSAFCVAYTLDQDGASIEKRSQGRSYLPCDYPVTAKHGVVLDDLSPKKIGKTLDKLVFTLRDNLSLVETRKTLTLLDDVTTKANQVHLARGISLSEIRKGIDMVERTGVPAKCVTLNREDALDLQSDPSFHREVFATKEPWSIGSMDGIDFITTVPKGEEDIIQRGTCYVTCLPSGYASYGHKVTYFGAAYEEPSSEGKLYGWCIKSLQRSSIFNPFGVCKVTNRPPSVRRL